MQSLSTADREAIVREFASYIVAFVEQPRPELGNLPVCPFARKARVEGRVSFEVLELSVETVSALLPLFGQESNLDLLICVHPSRDSLSCMEVLGIAKEMNRSLPKFNLVAIAGHPEDPFNIGGLYTRREPYPNIQLLRLDVGERAYKSLEKSGYYDRWSDENYRDLIPMATP